jgi:dTDP-glucose 4,6-dehydratase
VFQIVYGEILEQKFTGDDRLNPLNPYASTKAGAGHLAQSYYTTHDVPVVITRSSNNFGPRQHPERLIPKLILRTSQAKSLPIYGDGSNIREWIYVEDNGRAIETVRKDGNVGEVYNTGSGDERTNLQVAHELLGTTDANADPIEFVEDRLGHNQRYALNTPNSRY